MGDEARWLTRHALVFVGMHGTICYLPTQLYPSKAALCWILLRFAGTLAVSNNCYIDGRYLSFLLTGLETGGFLVS